MTVRPRGTAGRRLRGIETSQTLRENAMEMERWKRGSEETGTETMDGSGGGKNGNSGLCRRPSHANSIGTVTKAKKTRDQGLPTPRLPAEPPEAELTPQIAVCPILRQILLPDLSPTISPYYAPLNSLSLAVGAWGRVIEEGTSGQELGPVSLLEILHIKSQFPAYYHQVEAVIL